MSLSSWQPCLYGHSNSYTSLTRDLFGEESLERLLWKTFLTNQITSEEGSGLRLTSYNAKLWIKQSNNRQCVIICFSCNFLLTLQYFCWHSSIAGKTPVSSTIRYCWYRWVSIFQRSPRGSRFRITSLLGSTPRRRRTRAALRAKHRVT